MAQQQTQNDGWNVVSTTPIPKANLPGDGWNVVSTAPTQNPIIDMSAPVAGAGALGVPQPPAHSAVDMKPSVLSGAPIDAISPGTSQKILGANPISDTVTNVGSHLKNFVSGPYHAFADAPRNPEEAQIKGTNPDSGAVANAMGQFGLGASRILLQPTADALNTAGDQFKAGNYAPLNNYDDQGNYKPSVASSLMDAVPFVGPWNRNFQNEANTKGVVPAVAGLLTDAFAGPKLAEKIISPVARAGGSAARFASADGASRNLATTRLLTKGTPGQLLQSALKPAASYGAGAADMLEKGLPQVMKSDPNLDGVSGFANASSLARAAAAQPYTDLLSPYRTGVPSSISGAPIADAQMYSMPLMDQIERPHFNIPEGKDAFTSQGAAAKLGKSATSIYSKTAGVADNYRDNFSVPELDELRQNANSKLNAFYNKSGGDQAAALSNPETARVKAVGDSTRGVLYPYLEQNANLPEGTVAGIQNNFTHMSNVEDIANKREPIYARQDPIGLAQKTGIGIGDALNPFGAVGKLANFALQSKLGSLTNSDALVNSAVDRFKNPEGTPLVARPGLLPATSMRMGTAAKYLTPPLVRNTMLLAPKTTGKANK